MQQTLILVTALIVGALGGWLLLDGPAFDGVSPARPQS